MIQIANDETVDIAIRAKLWSELAQYVYPKRKSIDVSRGREDNGVRFVINLAGGRMAAPESGALIAQPSSPPPIFSVPRP